MKKDNRYNGSKYFKNLTKKSWLAKNMIEDCFDGKWNVWRRKKLTGETKNGGSISTQRWLNDTTVNNEPVYVLGIESYQQYKQEYNQ